MRPVLVTATMTATSATHHASGLPPAAPGRRASGCGCVTGPVLRSFSWQIHGSHGTSEPDRASRWRAGSTCYHMIGGLYTNAEGVYFSALGVPDTRGMPLSQPFAGHELPHAEISSRVRRPIGPRGAFRPSIAIVTSNEENLDV